jgi:hypothetical protein
MAQRSGLLEQLQGHLQPSLSSGLDRAIELTASPAR